jgi:uncharacterized coiled-coil DUF342 family protein
VATEHEIDRLVVRLVGNQQDYQKMLKDVERQTEESAKWAEDQGSKITAAFNKAFDSARGSMETLGSQMRKGGAVGAAAGAAVSAPMGKAALDFSEYGRSIKDLVEETEKAAKEAEELKKRLVENTEEFKELEKIIRLTEEQASVFNVMAQRTGKSVQELSKHVKVGSEEYEKWREEA